MKITGAARIAGIMGWPVTQSISPVLHRFWLEELGIDGALVPLPVSPGNFERAVRGIQAAGFKGASVTLPHKEAAFALSQDHDLAARTAGAVNLLVFHGDGRIEGRNTDATGLAASLREDLGGEWVRGKPVVVLGAGGAARAAAVALHDLGAAEVRILNRSRARAEQLVAALAPVLHPKLVAFEIADWQKAAADAALAIHTTSAGMKGAPSLAIDLAALPKGAALCDIVYNPLETDLVTRAKARGLKTIDGLGMLMHQGVPAFEAFFGARPKVTPALRAYLEASLGGK